VSILARPATELARLVRDGELTSRELVEASLAAIEAVEPQVNAYTVVDADGALAAADAVGPGDERPFAGVPIPIKDLYACAGLPLSCGSELLGDYVPDYDAHTVRRLRRAGFVVVGKTSTPEFGIVPVTEPRRFGPTRNPWDLDRTPGGSSGGAAAAGAAGTVPVAHGSDGGGSLRIPGACCGLVGLKPSRGRVSSGPDKGDTVLSQQGALTRTVGDAAALLDVLAGYERGDATWAPPPAEPFAALAARDPGRLRVALVFDSPLESPLDPQSERAARDAAELLESLGHSVDEVDGPWGREDLLLPFVKVFSTVFARDIRVGEALSGLTAGPDTIEPLSIELRGLVEQMTAPDYLLTLETLQRAARAVLEQLGEYDVALTPALAQRPVRIGEIDACSADPMEDFGRSGLFTPYTALFNVSGQPAVSLPLYEGDDGLPLAVQLAGPPAGEGILLALAAQLEAARPWADRRPPVFAGAAVA
jgi:amidase